MTVGLHNNFLTRQNNSQNNGQLNELIDLVLSPNILAEQQSTRVQRSSDQNRSKP